MAAPKEIIALVERFERNRDSYRAAAYNEAQVRKEFIDPFFEALGWDMANREGKAEAYKDVIHEASLKLASGGTKAPDYAFRVGGAPKFFLEAKKPAHDIKDEIDPAYQLRRYAWSAKLPLSILTDFEEFAVYDCRIRPRPADKASTARVLFWTYRDYADKWDEIAAVFSKTAIEQGSFDKFVESSMSKRGTSEVDSEFLADIEKWRDILAHNIASRNRRLSVDDLNAAVQRTIDRIIFLRMCEDRGIEPYGQLRRLLDEQYIYGGLLNLYERADEKYNSGLFYFDRETGRGEPDTLTPSIRIENDVLKKIIATLYYPDCPYEFSVLPAEILGNVYEQFLGKVIRLTKEHHAKVEEKPEVKKAGGVYYTPKYIVDYIVKNTVGKLCEGKTPQQISKLRILDPACGSGSFLLGAYGRLLDYHLNWYVNGQKQEGRSQKAEGRSKKQKRKNASPIYQDKSGRWKLTTAEKKRILLNNIYGVDIDPQAVEVTKLSLLLKVLEGENAETLEQQMRLFHERRALPDLDNNIKCGNSLIGPDYFADRLIPDPEEMKRVNPFDWVREFPEIFTPQIPQARGSDVRRTAERGLTPVPPRKARLKPAVRGFDCVIGNPPYVGFHGFAQDKGYIKSKYKCAKGKFDYYLPFIELGLRLTKYGGTLGYICPTNFTKRGHGEELRKLLRSSYAISEICDFEDVQIFKGALNYTGIFIIEHAKPSSSHIMTYKRRSLDDIGAKVRQSGLSDNAWIFRGEESGAVVSKVERQPVSRLEEIADGIAEGIVTGQNAVFLITSAEAKRLGLETKYIRSCLRGSNIRRYVVEGNEEVVIYPYKSIDGKTRPVSADELKKCPNLWSYLNARRRDLAGRGYFEKSSKTWYELWCPRDMERLNSRKIVVPELAESNRFAFTDEQLYYGDTVCGITIRPGMPENLLYILGLLNSRLMEFYYKKTTVPKANKFYIYKTMFLKSIPVRRIDFTNKADKSRHDKMVNLVERMLALHKQIQKAKGERDRTVIQRQIDSTDAEIDRLVYELYGLTKKEIAIVEESDSKKL